MLRERKREGKTYNFHGDNFSFGNVFDSHILPIFSSNSCIHRAEASPSKNVPNFIQFIQFSCLISFDRLHTGFIFTVAAGLSGLPSELNVVLCLLAHVVSVCRAGLVRTED